MITKIAIAVLMNVFNKLTTAPKTIHAIISAAIRIIKLVGMVLPEWITIKSFVARKEYVRGEYIYVH